MKEYIEFSDLLRPTTHTRGYATDVFFTFTGQDADCVMVSNMGVEDDGLARNGSSKVCKNALTMTVGHKISLQYTHFGFFIFCSK
jgi:hypothetical protein